MAPDRRSFCTITKCAKATLLLAICICLTTGGIVGRKGGNQLLERANVGVCSPIFSANPPTAWPARAHCPEKLVLAVSTDQTLQLDFGNAFGVSFTCGKEASTSTSGTSMQLP